MGLWDELLQTLTRPASETPKEGEAASASGETTPSQEGQPSVKNEEGEVVFDVVDELRKLQTALAAEWLHRVELGLETLELWYRRLDEGILGVPWEDVRKELESRIVQAVREGRAVTLPQLYGEVLSEVESAREKAPSQGETEGEGSPSRPALQAQPPGSGGKTSKRLSPEERAKQEWLKIYGFDKEIERKRGS